MTFDQLFADFKLMPEERTALAWHLGAYRMRKTIEALATEQFQIAKAALRNSTDGETTNGEVSEPDSKDSAR